MFAMTVYIRLCFPPNFCMGRKKGTRRVGWVACGFELGVRGPGGWHGSELGARSWMSGTSYGWHAAPSWGLDGMS